MNSGHNVVVIIRICGNTLACQRKGDSLHVRKVGKSTSTPAGQMGLFALLRDEGGAGEGGEVEAVMQHRTAPHG